jgi:hypothetical protein
LTGEDLYNIWAGGKPDIPWGSLLPEERADWDADAVAQQLEWEALDGPTIQDESL